MTETPFRYIFPEYKDVPATRADIAVQVGKICEEVVEACGAVAEGDDDHLMEELLDVVHACETALRHWHPTEVFAMRNRVLQKNRERGYYGDR